MNLSEARTTIEAAHKWANELHAQYTREDRINPDMRPHKKELTEIGLDCMAIMLACTEILECLDSIEDMRDEMNAANRSNAKRDFQG